MVVVLALVLAVPVTLFVAYLLLLLVSGLLGFPSPRLRSSLAPATPSPASLGAGGELKYSTPSPREAGEGVGCNEERMEAGGRENIAVVIPAYNEEAVIEATLASVFAQSVPSVAAIVIADNCTDATVALARAAGATVLERTDAEKRGKGWALAWAFEKLLRETDFTAFAILDADTKASPEFCQRMLTRLERLGPGGKVALQGRYGVLNEGDGWRAALMSAAFALVNHVRLLGADRLGGFVGLKGNGMVLTRALLLSHPWHGESITEDLDYALDLEKAGVKIRYAPDARVDAQMPVDSAAATTQRSRWERGRGRLVRLRAIELLRAGRVWAALDLATPPLGELCGLVLLWGLLTPFSPFWMLLWWAGALGGLLFYVLGGLLVSGVSGRVWLALLCAPFYVAWKLALKLARPTREWVRTERIPLTPPPGGGTGGMQP